MSDNYPTLDLRSVLTTLRRRAVPVLLLVLLGFAAVYLWSNRATKVYASNAEVRFSAAPSLILTSEDEKKKDDPVAIGNERYLISSASVRQTVRTVVGPKIADQIRDLDVTRLPDTDVLRITIRAESPEAAKEAANAYASTYVDIRQSEMSELFASQADRVEEARESINEQIDALDAQLPKTPTPTQLELHRISRTTLISQQAELTQRVLDLQFESSLRSGSVQVIKQAGLPTLPVSPTPLRDAGVAAVVLLVLGLGLAFLYEQLDTRIKTARDVESVVGGVPILGSVPDFGGNPLRFGRWRNAKKSLVPTSSPAAEAFRAIATGLRFSGLDKPSQHLLFTSATPGEGKTTVVSNLAVVLAEQGLRPVAVSADLRNPRLSEVFDQRDTEPGISTVLLKDGDLDSVLQPIKLQGDQLVGLLRSGPIPHNPGALLGSDQFGRLLDELDDDGADFALIDCAPVLPVSDTLAATRHVDGVVLIVRAGRTTKQSIREAMLRLQQVDAEVLGVVINGMSVRSLGNYGGRYGYLPSR